MGEPQMGTRLVLVRQEDSAAPEVWLVVVQGIDAILHTVISLFLRARYSDSVDIPATRAFLQHGPQAYSTAGAPRHPPGRGYMQGRDALPVGY